MVKDKVLKPISGRANYFRWRNHELLRIEAFSDAVFAFAVTLAVVSLEVPVTFHELLESLYGMFGFAICFLFLFLIWHQQYLYFRHFGLRDLKCIVLNAILLFTVLFYVYPLKFLFTLVTGSNRVVVKGEEINRINSYDDMRGLMAIYSVGLIAVYLTFMLLYLHAEKKKHDLHLSIIEQFHLRTQVYKNIVLIGFGVVSLLASATIPDRFVFSIGMIFILVYPALRLLFKTREKKLLKTITHAELKAHAEAVEKSKRSVH